MFLWLNKFVCSLQLRCKDTVNLFGKLHSPIRGPLPSLVNKTWICYAALQPSMCLQLQSTNRYITDRRVHYHDLPPNTGPWGCHIHCKARIYWTQVANMFSDMISKICIPKQCTVHALYTWDPLESTYLIIRPAAQSEVSTECSGTNWDSVFWTNR